MNEGWINIYENPPGSETTPCSCIWPTRKIAEKRRLEEHFVACVHVQWPIADLTNPPETKP